MKHKHKGSGCHDCRGSGNNCSDCCVTCNNPTCSSIGCANEKDFNTGYCNRCYSRMEEEKRKKSQEGKVISLLSQKEKQEISQLLTLLWLSDDSEDRKRMGNTIRDLLGIKQ